MRRLAVALLVALLLPSGALAEELTWTGLGLVRLSVPRGWSLASREAGDQGLYLRLHPEAEVALVAQITLVALPAGKVMRPEDVRGQLELSTQKLLERSVERALEPRSLAFGQGTGWVVQLTDASLVGKPPVPGDFKVVRSALAALEDDLIMLIATIQFDDPARPEVDEAMAILASLRFERGSGAPAPAAAVPFDFTVPESRVVVKVRAAGLRPDADTSVAKRYFKLERSEPLLILSGWLEPASAYKGLEAFWASETRSPAYVGASAPTRVEFLEEAGWEVVAFDIPRPGFTDAHLRAERVQAGTWIDLHLSSASTKPAAALREELLAALRAVEVVEK